MATKYQVFVSSTYEDLKDERRKVVEQILNLGHIPAGMEDFNASDDNQWDYIRRRILECDYYICIVAERYGSERQGRSYTRLEYEFAKKQRIPVAAFLLDEDARKVWPQGKVEAKKSEKVQSFRKLCETKLVKYWNNVDDLGAKVVVTLAELMREKPRIGWVRADTVAAPVALNEIARLSEEKRELLNHITRLEEERERSTVPSDIQLQLNRLAETRLAAFCPEVRSAFNITLLTLFRRIAKHFAQGITNWSAISHIAAQMGPIQDVSEFDRAANEVVSDFLVAGLLSITYVATSSFDKVRSERHLNLTEVGRKVVMYARLEEVAETDPQEPS